MSELSNGTKKHTSKGVIRNYIIKIIQLRNTASKGHNDSTKKIRSLFGLTLRFLYLQILTAMIKGIVSRDFCVLFSISLNRYEPPDRTGSCVFLILMTFLYLNFFLKLTFAVYGI
jgi:hypothetical protein